MLRGVRKCGMYRGTSRGLVQDLSKEVQWGSKGAISAQLGVEKRSGVFHNATQWMEKAFRLCQILRLCLIIIVNIKGQKVDITVANRYSRKS